MTDYIKIDLANLCMYEARRYKHEELAEIPYISKNGKVVIKYKDGTVYFIAIQRSGWRWNSD